MSIARNLTSCSVIVLTIISAITLDMSCSTAAQRRAAGNAQSGGVPTAQAAKPGIRLVGTSAPATGASAKHLPILKVVIGNSNGIVGSAKFDGAAKGKKNGVYIQRIRTGERGGKKSRWRWQVSVTDPFDLQVFDSHGRLVKTFLQVANLHNQMGPITDGPAPGHAGGFWRRGG